MATRIRIPVALVGSLYAALVTASVRAPVSVRTRRTFLGEEAFNPVILNPDFLTRRGKSIPVSTYVELPVYEMLKQKSELDQMSMAAWIRRVLIERLIEDGFQPEGVSI